MRVVRCQLAAHPRQVQHRSDFAHPVRARYRLIQAERLEQLRLVVLELPHHLPAPLPRRLLRGESRFAAHGNRLLQQNRHELIGLALHQVRQPLGLTCRTDKPICIRAFDPLQTLGSVLRLRSRLSVRRRIYLQGIGATHILSSQEGHRSQRNCQKAGCVNRPVEVDQQHNDGDNGCQRQDR